MPKPRIAIFDLTDCEGCEVELLNSRHVPKILENAEFVHFRLGQINNEFSSFDIAFIEGSAVTSEEVDYIKQIRDKSSVVCALGTCACFGGIAALSNHRDIAEAKRYVYGDMADKFETVKVLPLSAHIKVDFLIRGCPMVREDFENFLSDILAGRKPREHAKPVCIDCKTRENTCLLLNNVTCAGPVTYGGCGAPCPSAKMPCDGCRGPLALPEMSTELGLLRKMAGDDDIVRLFRKYAVTAPFFSDIGGGDK